LSNRRREQGGQSLVEFSLIVPLLFMLILLIIDFGRAFYVQVALQNGAREGARYGVIHPTWVNASDHANPNNIVYRASTEPAASVATANITVTCTDAAGTVSTASISTAQTVGSAFSLCATSGARIGVKVTTQFTAMTPIIGNVLPSGGLTLTGDTKVTIE
jgi:Flp pilus assembly protein TadG